MFPDLAMRLRSPRLSLREIINPPQDVLGFLVLQCAMLSESFAFLMQPEPQTRWDPLSFEFLSR